QRRTMFVKDDEAKHRSHRSRRCSDQKSRPLAQPVTRAGVQSDQDIRAVATAARSTRLDPDHLADTTTGLFDRVANPETMGGVQLHGPGGRYRWGSVHAQKEEERQADRTDNNDFTHDKTLRENRL